MFYFNIHETVGEILSEILDLILGTCIWINGTAVFAEWTTVQCCKIISYCYRIVWIVYGHVVFFGCMHIGNVLYIIYTERDKRNVY